MPVPRVLLRYHYFQPADGRSRPRGGPAGGDSRPFALIYSGVIPTAEDEPTQEILERLLLRHGTELRPHPRELRPIGTGDVLDLAGRGRWQVLPTGFRVVSSEPLLADVIH